MQLDAKDAMAIIASDGLWKETPPPPNPPPSSGNLGRAIPRHVHLGSAVDSPPSDALGAMGWMGLIVDKKKRLHMIENVK